MHSGRAASPFRAPSPFRQPPEVQYGVHQSLPTGPAQVGPGSITYTTSTGPDGRLIYQPYRAVAASYHTPSGLVSGIQWVKADPTSVLPPGGQSRDPGGWNTSGQAQSNPDWQREERRRRKEEQADGKRHRNMDGRDDSDYELRMAREWDAQSSVNRDRRRSFNAGPEPEPPVAFPGANGKPGGYPTHPSVGSAYSPHAGYTGAPVAYSTSANSVGHSRKPSANGGYSDLAAQFNDLGIGKKEYEERERKSSRPRRYSTNEGPYERPRTVSGNYSTDRNTYPTAPAPYPGASSYGSMNIPANPNPYPGSSYATPSSTNPPPAPNSYPSSSYVTPSPNIRPGEISYGSNIPTGYPQPGPNTPSSAYSSPAQNATNIGRSTTPFGTGPQVYPQPMVAGGTRSRAPSRAASPNPVMFRQPNASPHIGKSPRIPVGTIPGEPQQLPAPEAFSRPINAANTFMPFDMTKIQDMELYDTKLPKMPQILTTHDIYPEDWLRCMQDLGRSWTGQLPVPGFENGQPRRSTLAADLVDLWNSSFFFNRGVELILFKGRERRTGPQAGLIDKHLPHYDDDDSESLSSSADSDLDLSRHTNPYGRPNSQIEQQERRRRREKKARRNARSRDKTYTVYIACLSRPTVAYTAAGPQTMPGGYGVMSSASAAYNTPGTYKTPTYSSPGYGPPVGMPTTRSQGYGGGY